MIKYKFDIIDALNAAGYYRQKIKDGKLISQGSLTRIKRGEPVSIDTIDTICRLLSCQPGDLLEYVPPDIKTRLKFLVELLIVTIVLTSGIDAPAGYHLGISPCGT